MAPHVFHHLRYYAHSILFCTIPIVFLFSQNIGELSVTAVARPLLVSVALILLILAVLRSFIKNFAKSTVFVTISVILFFSYGFLKELSADVLWNFGAQRYDGHVALALIFLLWVCLSYLTVSRKVPTAVHDFLNVMGATTLAISLFTIGFKSFDISVSRSPSLVHKEFPLAPPGPDDANKFPDIIYIVPDRYPNNYVLRSYFDFDNEKFIDDLTERGFFVSEKAHANYLNTAQSLAATLNLQHITNLSDIFGENTGRWHPVYDLVQDHLVQRILRSRGYRFVHMGGWYPPTAFNKHADVNLSGRSEWLSQFETVLLKVTPVSAIWRRLQAWRKSSTHAAECERVKKKIEYLKHVGGEKEPVFVFAHLLIPHRPIKFDAEGNCINGPSITRMEEWGPFKKGYVEQLKYVSDVILDIFDAQRKNNPNSLIFVAQSDEGPLPISYRLQLKKFNWEAATVDDIMMKFGVLSAFYFYNHDYEDLNDYSSPVNNFRVIFNNIFRIDLPLLEDKAYIFKDGSHIFKFTDVTDKVRRLTGD